VIMKEEIFKTLFEFNPDPIIVFNAIGEIVLINQQAKILFGYKEAELKGKRIDFLMPAELVPIQSAMRFNYVQMPDNRTLGRDFEILAIDKEGRKFHVEK
jgi:PAS domain S-box-containing protein